MSPRPPSAGQRTTMCGQVATPVRGQDLLPGNSVQIRCRFQEFRGPRLGVDRAFQNSRPAVWSRSHAGPSAWIASLAFRKWMIGSMAAPISRCCRTGTPLIQCLSAIGTIRDFLIGNNQARDGQGVGTPCCRMVRLAFPFVTASSTLPPCNPPPGPVKLRTREEQSSLLQPLLVPAPPTRAFFVHNPRGACKLPSLLC